VSLTNAAVVGNTCALSANQFGRAYNGEHYAPATQITQSLTVSKGAQSVAFGAAPAVNVGGTGPVVATSNQGITPVSFSSNTTGICTVSGANNSTLTGVAVATCSITASAPANTSYLPATATQSVGIGIGTQTLTFGAVPSMTAGGTGSVSATSDRALTPVTLTSNTGTVCTISSGTVTGVTAGLCTLQATQSGSPAYSAASATLSFPINAAVQTLSFAAAPTINVGGTGTVAATSNQALSTVTLTSATPLFCTISGGMVSGVSTGTCTINAAAPGGATYLAATASLSFGVGMGSPTLTFGAVPLVTVGSTGSVSVTSDKSATPVSMTSTTPTCTLASGVVTGVSVGVCTLQATQAAASSYSAGSANLSFSIGAAPLICNLHMDGANPMLATVEGLILTRAMLGLRGNAVTAGTGITTPWDTIRVDLNAKCGTAFLP
jgi:large repetitive protein